jgi:hypothetical protein
MNENEYAWSPIFATVLLETNAGKLPQRVREAVRAIDKRLSDHEPMDLKELQAICDAKAALYRLERRGTVARLVHGLSHLRLGAFWDADLENKGFGVEQSDRS